MRRTVRAALSADGFSRRRLGFGLAAEGARLLPSLVTFVVVPRALGAAKYGQLAAVFALSTLVAALATLGAHVVMIRSMTRGDDAPCDAVGRAFTTTVIGGGAGLLVGIPVAFVFFDHVSFAAIVFLFASELLFGNLLHVFSALAIVREDQKKLASFVGVFAAARIGSTIVYALSPLRGTITGFALLYLAAVSAASFVCFAAERRRSTWPGFRFVLPTRRDIGDGLAISSTAGVFYLQDGLDTPIILRSGYAQDAGTYASAYRVVSLAYAPVNALVLIGLPRMVSRGSADGRERRTTVRLTLWGMAYGLAVFAAVMIAAPLIPRIIGHEFGPAVAILRWLSLLPFLRAIQYFVANNLMLNGAQRGRLLVQIASAVTSVVAYCTLIPLYSWKGAVAGTYISEVLLAAGLWLVFAGSRTRSAAERGQVAGALAA